ncbi:MAG: aminodeoxychorismate lyase [Eubacterium sp.]|nr:aminodeoxychorismate lyase [Eubacterium sp.]
MSASKIVLRIVSISFTVLVFILVVYGLYQVGLYSYDYGYRIFAEPAVTESGGTDKLVNIKESMDSLEIGTLLEEKGLVRDRFLFVLQLKLSAYSKTLKPGYYTLNTSMTAREMMQVMSGEDTEEPAEE